MKTIIILGVIGIIGFYSFKSLYKTLTGQKGCGCSGTKKNSCPMKGKCGKK